MNDDLRNSDSHELDEAALSMVSGGGTVKSPKDRQEDATKGPDTTKDEPIAPERKIPSQKF